MARKTSPLDLATAIAHQVRNATAYDEPRVRRALERLAIWSTKGGKTITAEQLLAPENVEQFVTDGLPTRWTGPSRSNQRALLRRVGEAIGIQGFNRGATYSRAEPSKPYSEDDVIELLEWCSNQRTAARSLDAMVLIALGLGAGLSAGEVAAVTGADVDTSGDEVTVAVRGARPRIVPVSRPALAGALRAVVGARSEPDAYLFRPQRTTESKNAITNFIAKSCAVSVAVSSQRLRVTWIVNRLQEGVSAFDVAELAGMQGIGGLARYARFARRR